MTRALLLDLDNTLIDRDAAVAAWIATVAPAGAAPALIALDRGGHGSRTAFFAAVGEAAGLSIPETRRRFSREAPAFVTLKPDADALLRAFPGITVVVSNGSRGLQRAKIEAAGLAGRVGHVLISGELGIEKPDAAIFREALARAGCAPHEARMIGDHPVADVQGAMAAGIPAVLVRTRWFEAPPGVPCMDLLTEVRW